MVRSPDHHLEEEWMSRFFDLWNSGERFAILSFALPYLASTAVAQSPLPSVPADSVWRQDISSAPVAADSSTVIGWLDGQGGWGSGTLRIDFSIEVLHADGSAPFLSFTPTGDFYDPDCDQVPVPVPAGGAIEGEAGYECVHDGDCHLLVVHDPTATLYEMWRADITTGGFDGGCLAVWKLNLLYPPDGRGEQCTSADAAGFPIAPLLISPDEVAAGSIEHALRFILPNSRMRNGVYVHPASHAGGPSGPVTAVAYGSRLRLRADYPLETLDNEAARTIARAMQNYGIVLADGGTIALTAQSDSLTTASWDGLGIDAYSLSDLSVTDFEIIDTGPPIALNYDCVRSHPILLDGFELGDLSRWMVVPP
jgi:serine/threonine-protein kinase